MPLDMDTQWGVALAKGNDTRKQMAVLRARIREMSRADGRREVARLLRDRDEAALPLKIGLLLKTPHRMGEAYTRQILLRARVNSETRVRDLDDLERERLIALVEPGASIVPKPLPRATPIPNPEKPARAPQPRSDAPMVPAGPFVDWLKQRFTSANEAGEILRVPKKPLIEVWHGRTDRIKEDIVDRALADYWETLDDLYPLENAA